MTENWLCRYAIGGFNGITMTPSVEIYDPRLGTWMTGEPMNQGRGYLCAAVIKDSIYVIGGTKTNEDIVEEVYNRYPAFSFPTTWLRHTHTQRNHVN